MRRSIDRIRIARIESVVDESPTVRTLSFSDSLCANAKPGQFAMVWLPRVSELPMSIMIDEKDGRAALTIRKHGYSSTALYNLSVNSMLGVRGPYGRSFDIKKGKLLLVGGGTGLVPLMRLLKVLAKRRSKVTLVMGSKSKDEVIFAKTAKKLLRGIGGRLVVTTEDGSYGMKGLATDVVEKSMRNTRFDMVYTCGPERMMKNVLEQAAAKGVPAQASLERVMKCGIGICGSCCVGPHVVCTDGPVLGGEQVLRLPEFGVNARDKSGRLAEMW